METIHFIPDEDSHIPDTKRKPSLDEEIEKFFSDLEAPGKAGALNHITVFETLATPASEIPRPEMAKEPIDDVTVFNTTYTDGSVSGDLD